MRPTLSIAPEPAGTEEAVALLRQSDAFLTSLYPPECCHLLDAAAFSAPHMRFLAGRLRGRAIGCGAVVLGKGGEAEVKRMFVEPEARGLGVGRAILETLENRARRAAMRVVQLETGNRNAEALGLYRECGYRECGPFGEYANGVSVFLEKQLL